MRGGRLDGYFYPRPPRGGRLQLLDDGVKVKVFLSTPSARRATVNHRGDTLLRFISIHALREEGDLRSPERCSGCCQFLSTPSARRATSNSPDASTIEDISIHALREEGDSRSWSRSIIMRHFYPRPPRGGRPSTITAMRTAVKFLSTPSARRATGVEPCGAAVCSFLSTPSARRATRRAVNVTISDVFLSTPSARRATLP